MEKIITMCYSQDELTFLSTVQRNNDKHFWIQKDVLGEAEPTKNLDQEVVVAASGERVCGIVSAMKNKAVDNQVEMWYG